MFEPENLMIVGAVLGGLSFGALFNSDVWQRSANGYVTFLIGFVILLGGFIFSLAAPILLFGLFPLNRHVESGGKLYFWIWFLAFAFMRVVDLVMSNRKEALKREEFERGIDIEIAERRAEMGSIDNENEAKH